jgi:hypothetical protein
MGFVAAAVIGSSVLGGLASRSAGKAAASAQRDAAAMQAEAFRFSKPYIKRNYDSAEANLQNAQSQGAYTGKTYAGPNDMQIQGNNYIGNMGAAGAEGAYNLTQGGQAFGQNANDIYNSSQADRMGNAQNYAMDNSQGLVDSAMRDDRRNLQENTLTGINQNASGTGNMNSSRAGVADAIANRGYDDRRADVTSDINQQLMDQSLDQQNQQFKDQVMANNGVSNAYSQGINSMGTMGDFMTGAGGNMQGFEQGQYNDNRMNFQNQRDFGLDQNIKYQQGILGNAQYQSPQNPVQRTASANAATFGGAMQGAGFGMKMADAYGDYQNRIPPAGTSPAPLAPAPPGYGKDYSNYA